jgi:hypothetical protein
MKMTKIKCDNCMVEFEKATSRIKRSKRHYCSRGCVDKHKKKTMKGKGNHMYGKEQSKESKILRSKAMMDLWRDEEYVERVLSSRQQKSEEYFKETGYKLGWSPESALKREQTFLETYGVAHNWSNKECREKCEQTCLETYGSGSLEMAISKIDEGVVEKRRRTLIETMVGIPFEEYEQKLSNKEKYYKKVKRITESQDLSTLPGFDKRGRCDIDPDCFHLDHVIPISYGWLNDIPPEVIGDISNLQFIPWVDNIKKSNNLEEK